ncbi:MAG: MOSC domain-containing protein [Gammaproteobacteria bacterium]|nr:MOSC domain-containing protein [Gammaproteobacteria bacterium]
MSATDKPQFEVASLWRYPVKSMMGEELDAAELTERGLLGDRAHALLDTETGRVASAKQPRKWGGLLDCRTSYVRQPEHGQPLPVLRFDLPNGDTFSSDHPEANEKLSDAINRRVTLQSADTGPAGLNVEMVQDPLESMNEATEFEVGGAAPGTFFDLAPIHLITTATLNQLRDAKPDAHFGISRFRPNIVVATPDDTTGFVENDWVGRSITIGDDVQLQVITASPRCIMTTLPQQDLPKDMAILRTVNQLNMVDVPVLGKKLPCAGVYATVLTGGRIQGGDPVSVQA